MTDNGTFKKRPPRSLRYQEEEEAPSQPEVQDEPQPESQVQPDYIKNIPGTTELKENIPQQANESDASSSAIRKSPILSSRIVYPPKTEEKPVEPPPASKEKSETPKSKKTKQTAKLSQKDAEEKEDLDEQIKEIKDVASETKEALQKIVDNYIKKLSDVLESQFAKIKAIFATILLKILKALTLFFNTVVIPIFKLLFKILDAIIKGIVLSIKNFKEGMKSGAKKVSKQPQRGSSPPSTQAVVTPPSPSGQKTLYVDLLSQNIIFLTFRKQPIVREDVEDKETAFMENILSDIKYCKRFVDKLPSPTEGPYAGRSIVDIFENVQEEDILKFFTYVQKYPEVFKDKDFKISEAFATWVIKKSKETGLESI